MASHARKKYTYSKVYSSDIDPYCIGPFPIESGTEMCPHCFPMISGIRMAIALARQGHGLILLFAVVTWASSANAHVIVIANRAPTAVSFELHYDGHVQSLSLNSGECIPVLLPVAATLSFVTKSGEKSCRVTPMRVYYFGEVRRGVVDIGEIALGRESVNSKVEESKDAKFKSDFAVTVIPVTVLFNNTGTPSHVWETSLRRRFEAASRVFRRTCFVEFKVVRSDTWQIPASIKDVSEALTHLERAAAPGRESLLVVGFSDRLKTDETRRAGGTRGPLHSHVLVRERLGRNSEKERLEVLVHELGHFLGAVHSAEVSSVMRPVLGNRRTWVASSGIIFDPLNTLAMCIVSNEVRLNRSIHLFEFSLESRRALRNIYKTMYEALPEDDTSPLFIELLGPLNGGN